MASRALLLEEFLAGEAAAGRIPASIAERPGRVLLHGHCHQKAFGTMGATERALALVRGLSVAVVESSCCGMAGAFGYGAETYEASIAMGELSLLPAVRAAPAGCDDRGERLLLPSPDPGRDRRAEHCTRYVSCGRWRCWKRWTLRAPAGRLISR